jgi:hypothetical protein
MACRGHVAALLESEQEVGVEFPSFIDCKVTGAMSRGWEGTCRQVIAGNLSSNYKFRGGPTKWGGNEPTGRREVPVSGR